MRHAPTDQQAEEAMRRMADYVDHLPLWHLAAHTAAEYPSEAFVRSLTTKEPLGPMMRKMRKEARLMADILNDKGKSDMTFDNLASRFPQESPWTGGPTQPFVSHKKVGRNDPCPCGSGKKYKHCCGRG